MSRPLRVVVFGCKGRVGQLLCKVAADSQDYELVGAIARANDPLVNKSLRTLNSTLPDITVTSSFENIPCDVIIDFSSPAATIQLIQSIKKSTSVPLIIGTTGFDDSNMKIISTYAQRAPVFLASNFSLGINLLNHLCKHVSQILGTEYNVEIVETHHNKKKDAPSGTALTLMESVANGLNLDKDKDVVYGRCGLLGQRPQNEIGVHALRLGSVIGDHSVYFSNSHEQIELKHRTLDRSVYASGALKAAAWLVQQKPTDRIYTMHDMLSFKTV